MAANSTTEHFELLCRASAPQPGQLRDGKHVKILHTQWLPSLFVPMGEVYLTHSTIYISIYFYPTFELFSPLKWRVCLEGLNFITKQDSVVWWKELRLQLLTFFMLW